MPRFLLAVLLVLPCAGYSAAGQADADSLFRAFEAGNEAYEQGQYARAIDAYRSVLKDGQTSAELYYNLGNAYFRSDEIGRAIQYYEKARTLHSSDERIQHNLEQARERVPGTAVVPLPPSWTRLVANWPPLLLFLAGLMLVVAGSNLAVTWTEPGDDGRWGWTHPVSVGLVAAGFLIAAVALGISYLQDADHRAVVVADRAPVHPAPDANPNADPDTTLAEGTLIHLASPAADPAAQSEWSPVRLSDGRTGWIPAPALGRID